MHMSAFVYHQVCYNPLERLLDEGTQLEVQLSSILVLKQIEVNIQTRNTNNILYFQTTNKQTLKTSVKQKWK